MRGKYSPTVSRAYMMDQNWWDKFAGNNDPAVYNQFDPEGFDSYGYNKDDVDRAGNLECEYYHNDGDYDQDEDYNLAYDAADRDWGFDGTKPVRK